KPFGGWVYRGDAAATTGTQWASITGTATQGTRPHADSRFMTFDANGNLVETDDGGIYRLGFGSFPGKWGSVNGHLKDTELFSAAYDSVNNVLLGGAQDNGSPMQSRSDPSVWTDIGGGDGGSVAIGVDPSAGNAQVYYVSGDGIGGFDRRYVQSGHS